MQKGSRTHIVLKNAAFRLFGHFFPIIFSIAITPLIVNRLGISDYGLMTFVNSLLSVLGLLDVGIASATVKHIAESLGRNDEDGAVRAIHTANSLFLIMGTLGMVVIGGIFVFITIVYPDRLASNPEVVPILVLAALSFFINAANGVYTLIPTAFQRFDIGTMVNSVLLTVGSIGNLLAVLLGGTIVSIFAVNAVLSIVFVIVWQTYSVKIFPRSRYGLAWSKEELKKSVSFSFYASINELARSALFSLDRLLIPIYGGTARLAYYTIPGNLTARIPGVSDNIAGTLFPMFAHLNAAGDKEAMKTAYVRSSRIILMVSAAITAGIAFNGFAILKYWINPDVAMNGATVIVILALTNFLLALFSQASNVFVALGIWKTYTKISVSMALINVGALVLLLPRYGIEGAAWAYLISTLPILVAIYVLEKKHLNISGSLRHWSMSAVKVAGAAFIFYVANWFIIKPFIVNLWTLIVLGPLSVLLFIIIYMTCGFLPREDIRDVIRLLKSAWRHKSLWPIKLAINNGRLVWRMKTFAIKSRLKRNFGSKSAIAKSNLGKPVYSFAILVIKKTRYADMAINNINSLHYLNPAHTATLYCDAICANYLEKRKKRFDYPNQVTIKKIADEAIKPWQHYKIDVHIEAAKNGQIDTDADGIWHDEPVIDRTKITMLAYNSKIKETPNELTLVTKAFNKPEWGEFGHRVAAFVSIPTHLMTDKLAADMRHVNDFIFNHPLEFISNEKEKGEMRRLSEELAVNLSLQSNYPGEKIAVLKEKDGPNDKHSLQSLYYGCFNQVNE